MKLSVAFLVCLSLSVCLVACGQSSTERHASTAASTARAAPTPVTTTTTTARSVATVPPSLRSLKGDEDDDETGENLGNTSKDNDADFDNDLKPQPGYDDADDGPIRNWGNPASATQELQLKGIVKRYFAAATSGDGGEGCSLLDTNFANSVPEDYGQAPGPTYARGKTCAVVLSAIFKHAHTELSGPVLVTAVRVGGSEALTLVGSTTMSARYVLLQRPHGVWGIVGLLGNPMP